MPKRHTRMPLMVEMGPYTGAHWLIATVELFDVEKQRAVTGNIVTDHVSASDLEAPGDPESDLRLWAHANKMLDLLYEAEDKVAAYGEWQDDECGRNGCMCTMPGATPHSRYTWELVHEIRNEIDAVTGIKHSW